MTCPRHSHSLGAWEQVYSQEPGVNEGAGPETWRCFPVILVPCSWNGCSGLVFAELSSLALPKKSVFSTMNMLVANRNLQFHRSHYLNMDPGLEDNLVLKSMLRCSLCFILHGHPWASYKFCGVSTRKCHASSPLHAELGSPSQQLQVD